MNLNGKTAVVTGGTKGIGYAIAESLVGAGANVFICGRSNSEVTSAAEALSQHGKAAGCPCDVRDENQVKAMLESASDAFGGIDVLINNAGVGYIGKNVEETSVDEFKQTLETNLFGVFYATRLAIPMIKHRGGGYIINISSLAGQNAHPGMAAYNAS